MATQEQMATIEAQTVNAVAREMMRSGVKLSYDQSDAIGDVGMAWLESRLGLSCVETDRCVECQPA